jgi:hypothetical protein
LWENVFEFKTTQQKNGMNDASKMYTYL